MSKYILLFALVFTLLIQEVTPSSVEDPYGGKGGGSKGGSKGKGSKGKTSKMNQIKHAPKPKSKPKAKPIKAVGDSDNYGSCMNGAGTCQDSDSVSCNAGYQTGLCPGAANIQCCPSSSSNGNTGSNTVNPGSGNGGGGGWSGLGVDVSGSCNGFSCLKNDGYNYAIVRCWRSTGTFDPYCISNIQAAQNAGMSPVDVYMFPQPTGASGASQANGLWNGLSGLSSSFTGTIWIDVEQLSPYWSSTSNNQQFFNDVVSTLQAAGANVGVYTSKSQWQPIMGSSFNAGSSLPLWYAHYDQVQSFSDWSSTAIGNYGGWSSPSMKQYNGDLTLCGCGVDVNWAPGN